MGHHELINWEKWHPHKVAYFLREICYKNPVEYRPIQSQIVHSKFGGESFRDADEYTLEKKLFISDHLHKRFVLNARRVLQEQTTKSSKQVSYLNFDASITDREYKQQFGTDKIDFTFTNNNLLQMAEFFEDDLTGQSKRKLWEKVDKDESSLRMSNVFALYQKFQELYLLYFCHFDRKRFDRRSGDTHLLSSESISYLASLG